MAKASWVSVSPASGSGDSVVSISSVAPHTGRTARSSTVTFSAAGVSDVPIAVNQAGASEFVTFQSSATAAKGGATVTLTGKSNTSALTFSLGSGTLDVPLPSSYLANSVSTANGATIVGDPGATAEFSFSIQLAVPENVTVDDLTRQIVVEDNAGHTAICLLTQSAGDAYLSVTPTTIELTAAGTAEDVSVSANIAWTAS